MVRLREVIFLIIVVAPGCAITIHEQNPSNEEPISTPRREQFADLITAPGQRYSISHTPAPIEGPIPSSPPAPLVIRSNSLPKPANDVPPPSEKVPVPTRPEDQKTSDATPLVPSPFQAVPKPDTPFLSAARAYEDGRADFAQEHLRTLPIANQDLLAKLFPAVAKVAQGNLSDPKEADEILTRIEAASDLLRPRTELKLEALRLCSRFVDFGEYTPLNGVLSPGQYVFLYTEVKGFVPEVISIEGEPRYSIHFVATLRIRGNGKTTDLNQKFNRTTRSIPHDICIPYPFVAPMQPGYYSAELELVDTAGRRAKRSMEFRVEERK